MRSILALQHTIIKNELIHVGFILIYLNNLYGTYINNEINTIPATATIALSSPPGSISNRYKHVKACDDIKKIIKRTKESEITVIVNTKQLLNLSIYLYKLRFLRDDCMTCTGCSSKLRYCYNIIMLIKINYSDDEAYSSVLKTQEDRF